MHTLTELGAIGFVWTDARPDAISAHGVLADRVAPGRPVADCLIALVGLEAEIASLRAGGAPLVLPNLTMNPANRDGRRLDILVVWVAAAQRYLVLMCQVAVQSDLEIELARQSRLRLIAETELEAKSRAIARANAELSLANQDLEEFASVVSHDLQAPLRALRYLAADADAALARGEADAARTDLARFREQLARMGGMLTGLLEYASVGRKTEIVEPVDTARLVRQIASSFSAHDRMRIEIAGDWPAIDTLVAPLDLVIRNLIDNAIKHHDRRAGRIVVTAAPSDRMLEISVADDGPGITPAWREAVFQPFRKGEAAGEGGDGAGIGLAMVRKAVERIGGSIALVSNAPDERGTTFIVRWPLEIHD